MTTFHSIPQMEPWFGEEEKKAINNYMDSGGWVTEFKKTTEFENKIAAFVGAKHAVACCNGTVALTMINSCLGFGPGDEILVPNYTMIATANSVVAVGATPILVDVESSTLCMDLDLAEKALTSRTRALILMNANGREPIKRIEEFKKFAEKNNLVLIEDSCQALGCWYENGGHMGTAGIAGAFSFSVPKIISTGQGGAVVTNSDEFANKLRKIKDFGRSGGGNDIHGTIGYNFKITELQAVIGLEQLKKLDFRIARKKEIYLRYQEGLRGIKGVEQMPQDITKTIPWFIDVIVESRDNLVNFLKKNNIGTRVMYPPINKQHAYQISGRYPVSELIGVNGLWLPSATQITNNEIDFIAKRIAEFYGN